ncbi:MAG: histidine kinase dimerization/phospho-acceptor domain-containing protein, partial [Candidatus Latescibacterota bacterium]
MLNEAKQLMFVVNVSAGMSIHSLDVAEQLTADRLLDNARLIENITRSRIPQSNELRKIAQENDLQMISILDRNGNFISRTNTTSSPPKNSPLKHRQEVYDVLSGKVKYKVIGFMGESYYSGMRYGVVVGGEKIGAVVISTESGRMLDLRKEIGIGNLFKRISVPKNVRYIVLQDTLGIIASSPGVMQITRISEDPFLLKAVPGNFSWRFIPSGNVSIFEIVQPLVVDDYNIGLIRIGLDSSVFRDITNRAKKNFIILFFITVFTAILLFLQFILRQNYQLLNQEHDRILSEVRKMEEDAWRNERLTSMGRLAAGVAHEIRNPLNSINMLVQLLDTEFQVVTNKEQYSHFLSSVKSEISRISIIVENFLKFSKPPELILKNVNIKQIVEDVIGVISE